MNGCDNDKHPSELDKFYPGTWMPMSKNMLGDPRDRPVWVERSPEHEIDAEDDDCKVFTVDGQLWLRCDVCRTVHHYCHPSTSSGPTCYMEADPPLIGVRPE